MCKICTGKIHNENLYTLTELNVVNCSNLTSEKLQEVLIQCKNLETLWCFNCPSLTSLDLRNNINLKELYCNNCTSLISLDLRNNINLIQLECSNCKSLTSLNLQNNINLTILWCLSCKSLTSLDLRNNINLKKLGCSYCISLTSLDLPKKYKGCINHSDCYWIIQNKYFSINLQRLIRIQRWYRRTLIIKYMKSQEFIEWIYNPSNIGGRLYKIKLSKEFLINN